MKYHEIYIMMGMGATYSSHSGPGQSPEYPALSSSRPEIPLTAETGMSTGLRRLPVAVEAHHGTPCLSVCCWCISYDHKVYWYVACISYDRQWSIVQLECRVRSVMITSGILAVGI